MIKSKKQFFTFLGVLLVVLGISFWLTLDAVKITLTQTNSVSDNVISSSMNENGWDVLVGIKDVSSFNIFALVSLLLALIGLVLALFTKKFTRISAGCLVIAGVILFLTSVLLPLFYTSSFQESLGTVDVIFAKVTTKASVSLTFWSILSGAFFVGGAGCIVAGDILDKK